MILQARLPAELRLSSQSITLVRPQVKHPTKAVHQLPVHPWRLRLLQHLFLPLPH